MQLIVNGEEVDIDVHRLDQLVEHYQLNKGHVIAEVNGQIIDRSEWEKVELTPGVAVELVHFVGGG